MKTFVFMRLLMRIKPRFLTQSCDVTPSLPTELHCVNVTKSEGRRRFVLNLFAAELNRTYRTAKHVHSSQARVCLEREALIWRKRKLRGLISFF